MLLTFQEAITWCWKNLYEVKAPFEVKDGAANTELGSMTFDKVWTLDSTVLTFSVFYILLNTLIAF